MDLSSDAGKNVVVVGIGAMGGGMARALLDSPAARIVIGYDKFQDAVEKFYQEASAAEKAPVPLPRSLGEAIAEDTDFAILSLVNESQCEEVCFGTGENLLSLMPVGSCVILTSTVTATWAKRAEERFKASEVRFVDCPISGGPARARDGDLTLMASGEADCLLHAKPVLDALAREVHIIEGGAGAGSTVKSIHQLLAGVHICAAAEALAMAAKAGIDVEQMYRIVNGAAGASWMFADRGKRMLTDDPEVRSALSIFVKDLDIVYAEAKRLMSPIPVASAALQQFISGQSLGLGKLDDSQVIKVYENVTKVPASSKKVSGVTSDNDEGRLILSNTFVKVLSTNRPAGPATCIIKSSNVLSLSVSDEVIDIELLRVPPKTHGAKLDVPSNEIVGSFERFLVYKLTLPPGIEENVSYPFFHLSVSANKGSIQTTLAMDNNDPVQWTSTRNDGEIHWKEPTCNLIQTNRGESLYEEYIVQLI